MTRGPISSRSATFHFMNLGCSNIFADYLPAEIHKRLVNICSLPCRSLVIRSVAPAFGDRECSSSRHSSIFLEIRLIANYYQWNSLVILDSDNLLPELIEFIQATQAGDGKDKKKPLARLHVQFSVRAISIRLRHNCYMLLYLMAAKSSMSKDFSI